MRKIVSVVLLAVLMVFSITGCSGGGSNAGGGSSDADSGPFKIGVIMYQWTDAQGQNIQNYCKYLEENLNVEFVFEATNYNDDAQVACVENLISAGCDAIISGYDTNLVAAMDTCNAANVYYAVALDYISPEDFAGSDVSEFFLGGTQQFGGDTEALGATYAEAVNAADVTFVGGSSFPAWAFNEATEIYAGFTKRLSELNSDARILDLAYSTGFTPDEVQAAAQTVINENPGLQALFGMSSGLDFVYPILQGTDVKLISMGYDDSVGSLIENGSLIAAGNNNHTQSIASCVARIFNALEGNQYPDAGDGAYNKGEIVNGVASYPVISTSEELADYESYVLTEDDEQGSVTADELKSCILSENPDATLADLNELTNRSVEEIKAVRV
jgi:ABC-type sugar transport system substrate-binding protein